MEATAPTIARAREREGDGRPALASARWLVALALVALGAIALPGGSPAWAQELRIASYNMERLGQDRKDYGALARVVAGFDLVAAEEVMNGQGMASILALLGPGWSDAMSDTGEGSSRYQEHFGFFYSSSRVALVQKLGEFPRVSEFFRPPFGAQFRSRDSGLLFNLVACHIVYGKSERRRVAEISHLGEVYRYFEGMTGNHAVTMIVGDFNEERSETFGSLAALDDREVIPPQATTIGPRGPAHAYDHMFLPPGLLPLEVRAGVDYWTTDYGRVRKLVSDHFPVYVVLRTGKG